MSWRRWCQRCGVAPVAFTAAPVCFACWPGGPLTAPPCLTCGTLDCYFTNGLCARCHRYGSPPVDSCRDCLAWGATRHHSWRCIACAGWRQAGRRPIGTCRSCQRTGLPLAPDGACRLCRKQRTRTIQLQGLRTNLPDVTATSSHVQQLFFADMFILTGGARVGRRGKKPPGPPPVDAVLPVPYRQERLFDWPPDLRIARRVGFGDPPDSQVTDTLLRYVDARAARYGWSKAHASSTRGAIKVLLSFQATPGAPIRASDVKLLAQLDYSVPAVAAVLADAGMLDDDLEPSVLIWFRSQTADLPDSMRDELAVWLDVMRHGSPTPPRRLPRKDTTTVSQMRAALPAIRHWATGGYTSLRQVTRDDIKAILPASGHSRGLALGAHRSIFRVLKARQLVFTNPTTHMHARQPDATAPAPVDLAGLRAALGAHDPARAAIAALLAFHAIAVTDLRAMHLTDLRDGRLHLGDRTVLLAAPARDCLAAYLDYRATSWPNTINPHLFINRRSATHDQPVNQNWFRDTLGMAPEAVRRDRILDEAIATGGDLRQLTDLFGIHVATAHRYADIVHRATTAERAGD